MESRILGLGIRTTAEGIRILLTIGVWNPCSTNKNSGIQYLWSGIHRVEFKTQDFFRFPYITGRRFFKKFVLYRPYRRFPAAPLQLILYSSEQALWGALAAGREKEGHIWQLSPRGATREVEFQFQRRSCNWPAKTSVSPRSSPRNTSPATKSEEKRMFSQAVKVAITSSPSFSRHAATAPRRACSQAINFAPHSWIPWLQERLGLNCSPRTH